MEDFERINQTLGDEQVPAEAPVDSRGEVQRKKRKSIFRDPVVRALTYVAAGLVVLYLVAVVSALLTGVLGSSEPRTKLERDIQYYQGLAMQDPSNTANWKAYIEALIADRQYVKAQDVIDQATAAVDQTASQDILFSQARLHFATGDLEASIETCDEVRANLKTYYDAAKARTGSPESRGKEINENYWIALLVKAEALHDSGDSAGALACLDEYLVEWPTAADVFVRRGGIRAQQGDRAGAEADYREALKYLPGDEAALAGLQEIGVEQ